MKLAFVLLAVQLAGSITAAAGTTQPAFTSQPVEKNGLQVTAICEKSVFARNEPIKFTLRFKNVTDKPLSLGDAVNFQDWIIRVDNLTSGMPWRIQSRAIEPRKGPVPPKELEPDESVDISTDWGSNRFPFQYESELILNLPIPPVDGLSPGVYRLWIGVTLKKDPDQAAAHLAFRGDINLGPVEIEISDKDDPTEVQSSDPVTENKAEFQTVARPKWHIPAAGEKSEVQLGLRITNRSATWMQINVFDTIEMNFIGEHEKSLPVVMERDAAHVPEPVLLTSRESRTIYRNATLEWSRDGKSLRLVGSDGAGGHWHVDGLKEGQYTIHFSCENDKERLKPVIDRPAKHAIAASDAPFWMGTAVSRDLHVEIVPAATGPATTKD
jgi:hypothetical protein